jgi:hypothetical protein
MLPTLSSEHQLGLIEAAAVPHMKAASQREIVRRHARMAGTSTAAKPATTADLASIGITVEEVTSV